MAFPLRSNIFRDGSHEQLYFSQFPIQVAVLFSPTDKDFVDVFRSIFLDLDKLTGDNVAFFAVLDPPEDWIKEAIKRTWWQEYTRHIGRMGFSIDDRVLFREIMRLFDIGWSQLPQIVVGTNLWMGEFVKIPTSPFHIQRQLEALASLVRNLDQPNIDHIAERLSEDFGSETQYHPPDNALIDRLSSLYRILDTVESSDRTERYARLLNYELGQMENTLRRVRDIGNNRGLQVEDLGEEDLPNSSATDAIIEDAAGRLIAPATVAMRIFERFHQGQVPNELTDRLEEESLVMIATAIRNGDFLENLEAGPLQIVSPLRLGSKGRIDSRRQPSFIDFAAGAQSAWKTFELEVNLSLIQAARASISIRMPNFFAIYDSNFTKSDKILTVSRRGGTKPHYINQRDRTKQTERHKFLTLGDALAVTRSLLRDPDFENILSMCLDYPLPAQLLTSWEKVLNIRNRGSHIEPLQYEDYKDVMEIVLSLETFDPLIKIKRRLSSLPPLIISTRSDDMRKAESYKQAVEALRDSHVAGQIQSYYQNWKQLKAPEARKLLAKAIVEKVRKAGHEKLPTIEKPWYQELLASLKE